MDLLTSKSIYPDKEFFKKDIIIVDIRRESEQLKTGIVKGSKTVTFFDAQGNYSSELFFKALDKVVNKDKEFAIICRTGRRTSVILPLLKENGYKVIDLKGGVMYLSKIDVELVKYSEEK
jgi:rhodanese-related sulfurtransferase